MRGVTTRLAAIGTGLVALAIGGALLHVPGAVSVGSTALVRRFVLLLAVSAALYGAATRVVLRDGAGGRGTFALVLAVAFLMRLPALFEPPFLSSDLYRYIWDGRVQLAGINPYRYIPADPALLQIRDHRIFDHINRRFYAPTIYPPAAQLMFRLIASVGQTALVAKLAAVACECVAVACLALTLRLCGDPPSRVLIYAWNPLAVWSFAGNGHVDAEAVGLVAAALLARAARQDGWAGAAIGAATLVKFLPAVVAPALWRGRWRLPLAAAIVIVALYLPFIAVGPRRVIGFLGAYSGEEELGDGKGIWLLAGFVHLVHLPHGVVVAYACLAMSALGFVALAIARRPVPNDRRTDVAQLAGAAGLLAGLTMLLLSPHYSWYFPFLAVFAVLRFSRALIWMSIAPLGLYLSPWHEFFFWPALVYLPAIILFCRDELVSDERSIAGSRERIAS